MTRSPHLPAQAGPPPDPAAAPLGTDDEAGGAHVSRATSPEAGGGRGGEPRRSCASAAIRDAPPGWPTFAMAAAVLASGLALTYAALWG